MSAEILMDLGFLVASNLALRLLTIVVLYCSIDRV
jgi:hypothetical protein